MLSNRRIAPSLAAGRPALWAVVVSLPLIGLYLLLSQPQLDIQWQHHPAHFWLVLAVAFVNFVIGVLMSEAARRRGDVRVFLVALALLTSSGYFALHALATPGVLVPGKNTGFVIATPVGLLLAALFALLSALDWPPSRAAALMRWQLVLRGALIASLVAWAAVSLMQLPPLDRPLPEQAASTPLSLLAAIGVVCYATSATLYYRLYRRRRAPLLLAITTAMTLLAEAMVAVALGHTWHATWWEWHLLMLVAFGLIAYSVRIEWRTEGSMQELFTGIYLDETRAHHEQLSVLFADLQGFTTYAERAAPDRVKEMLDTYFGGAAPLARTHGGTVDKTIGDALMVVFRAHGHALRACRMALAFQQEMSRIQSARPDWPRFRVGINSGQAMVGLLDVPGARAFTVTGDTVNVASRLQGQARPGEVVIAEATRLEVGEVAITDELGPLAVKGRQAPVRAFLLRGLVEDGR